MKLIDNNSLKMTMSPSLYEGLQRLTIGHDAYEQETMALRQPLFVDPFKCTQERNPNVMKEDAWWTWKDAPATRTTVADRSSWNRAIHPPLSTVNTARKVPCKNAARPESWMMWNDSTADQNRPTCSPLLDIGQQRRDEDWIVGDSVTPAEQSQFSWNPFMSPTLVDLCPLTSSDLSESSPEQATRSSPWSTSSSSGSSPEKSSAFAPPLSEKKYWGPFGASIASRAPSPPCRQYSTSSRPRAEEHEHRWSSGTTEHTAAAPMANLERNIRWLANSQLHPCPPSKLSAPHNCHRRAARRPILGTSLMAVPQTRQPFNRSTLTSSSPPSAPRFQRSQRKPSGAVGSGYKQREATMCPFCKKNGETQEFYTTHKLKDCWGRVICPVLRAYTCPNCGLSGDHAHTLNYCPHK